MQKKATGPNNTTFAIILITSLFFLWGFALNLNPILIPHLKKACQLTDTQSAFIDSASYFAYFLLAIPAGKFMERFGYKSGIILGLFLAVSKFAICCGFKTWNRARNLHNAVNSVHLSACHLRACNDVYPI